MKHSTYPLILQIVIAMLFVRFVRVEAFTKVPRVPCMQSSPLAAPSLAERIVVRDEKPPTLVKVVAHLPLLASVLVARTRELWREAREGGEPVPDDDAESRLGVLLAACIIAPPLALAREVALNAGHLLARPVKHVRYIGAGAVSAARYVSWATTPTRPSPPPRRLPQYRHAAAPLQQPQRVNGEARVPQLA